MAKAKYRHRLPQLDGGRFITDGGIETTMIYHEGLELPLFASFDLLKTATGSSTLMNYFARYAALAKTRGIGCVLESATWRCSAGWGRRLGYSAGELAEANRTAIEMLVAVREMYETAESPMVISGCIGPRGDGYRPDNRMSAAEAQAYHAAQVDVFAGTAVDMITATTMNYVEEAIGITRAAQAADMPVVVSFTVETDGRLPTGETLREALAAVESETNGAPAYYMINCAHPTHFHDALAAGDGWTDRIMGLRANASAKSHAELDAATELDAGDPEEFGRQHRELLSLLRNLRVLGGCCGTDHRHIDAISRSCFT